MAVTWPDWNPTKSTESLLGGRQRCLICIIQWDGRKCSEYLAKFRPFLAEYLRRPMAPPHDVNGPLNNTQKRPCIFLLTCNLKLSNSIKRNEIGWTERSKQSGRVRMNEDERRHSCRGANGQLSKINSKCVPPPPPGNKRTSTSWHLNEVVALKTLKIHNSLICRSMSTNKKQVIGHSKFYQTSFESNSIRWTVRSENDERLL